MKQLLGIVLSLLVLSGCTRPTAGYSFTDLVRGASLGLREYEEWVRIDERRTPFPNQLCLAGIYFEVSLAETRDASGSFGLPLAGPVLGPESILGIDLTYSDTTSGNVVVPVMARYPRWDEKDQAVSAQAYTAALNAFKSDIPNLRARYAQEFQFDYPTAEGRIGKVRLPHDVRPEDFDRREDLAAELWRIRQALHELVLNSPFDPGEPGADPNYLLVPGELVFTLNYTVTERQQISGTVSPAVAVGPAPSASGQAGRGASEMNRMRLVYLVNQAPYKMRCFDRSIDAGRFAALNPTKLAPGQPVQAVAPTQIPNANKR